VCVCHHPNGAVWGCSSVAHAHFVSCCCAVVDTCCVCTHECVLHGDEARTCRHEQASGSGGGQHAALTCAIQRARPQRRNHGGGARVNAIVLWGYSGGVIGHRARRAAHARVAHGGERGKCVLGAAGSSAKWRNPAARSKDGGKTHGNASAARGDQHAHARSQRAAHPLGARAHGTAAASGARGARAPGQTLGGSTVAAPGRERVCGAAALCVLPRGSGAGGGARDLRLVRRVAVPQRRRRLVVQRSPVARGQSGAGARRALLSGLQTLGGAQRVTAGALRAHR
jgi:hypothetical protein